MKKYITLIVIVMTLAFVGVQNLSAQMVITVKFPVCYDNCSTQGGCVYRVDYAIADTCGGLTEWCSGYNDDMTCDHYDDDGIQFACEDCSDVSHNPCYRVAILVRKICIEPSGPIVICQANRVEYHTCEEMHNLVINITSWN